MNESKITISKNELINILEKSFEEGYFSYLEMKEDCVNSILNDYLNSRNFSDIAPNEIQIQPQQLSFSFDSSEISRNSHTSSSLNNITLTTNYF